MIILLQLLGSLGVFLFGMKLMSEGLQRVAGSRLKRLLSLFTSNRFSGVLSGFALTAFIQSSSATTVMVVGFVTAGLITLTQAIGMIMGANIGTTVTAWMVSLLGFKVNVSAFSLPAVGFGLVLTFLRSPRKRDWGEVLIGFGLLFLGLSLMQDSIPTIDDPESLAWMGRYVGHGMWSVMLFVLAGAVFTVILQSSSATAALTLTLAAKGLIPYELAVAMILGENVGTTLTANLAALSANTDARRAALVHFLFNCFGVAWALLTFHTILLPVVNFIVPGDPNIDMAALADDRAAQMAASGIITTHLAVLHTFFNVVNTLLMLPFVGGLERLVRAWLPDKVEAGRLRFIHQGLISAPELMLVQARREMQRMTEEVRAMFTAAMRIVLHPDEKLGKLMEETLAREELVDALEADISRLLVSTARTTTTERTAARMAEMAQNTHRLERIGDHCTALVHLARRNREAGTQFGSEDEEELLLLAGLVDEALENLGQAMAGQSRIRHCEALEQRIDDTRKAMRDSRLQRLQNAQNDLAVDLAFLDTISLLEEIGDRASGIIRLTEENTRRLPQ